MAAITIALAAKHLAMQLTQAYDAQYKALYNAVQQSSLFLNVWTLNTLIYHPFLVAIDIFCLLGIDNDQIDDDAWIFVNHCVTCRCFEKEKKKRTFLDAAP